MQGCPVSFLIAVVLPMVIESVPCSWGYLIVGIVTRLQINSCITSTTLLLGRRSLNNGRQDDNNLIHRHFVISERTGFLVCGVFGSFSASTPASPMRKVILNKISFQSNETNQTIGVAAKLNAALECLNSMIVVKGRNVDICHKCTETTNDESCKRETEYWDQSTCLELT